MAADYQGCYTALITPMSGERGADIDYEALHRLLEFQLAGGVSGILAMGTTGESATLSWQEHGQVIGEVSRFVDGRCTVIGGTGSNCTAEAINSTRHAVSAGIDTILLVEPYYNGPSSLEIRREYMEPVAQEFPEVEVIPYVIPGRSGTQLLPEDLALMAEACDNVNAVKEASGDLNNMRRTRETCGPEFHILSGDDGKTHRMMTDPAIGADGVVSVVSNVAPGPVQRMTECLAAGDREEGERLQHALQPLFDIVTVQTREQAGPHGRRLVKGRNPLPIKTLMRLLGMPSGPLRRPLGRMTPAGLDVVLSAAREVWQNNPEVLEPVETAFDVDVEDRLTGAEYRRELAYHD